MIVTLSSEALVISYRNGSSKRTAVQGDDRVLKCYLNRIDLPVFDAGILSERLDTKLKIAPTQVKLFDTNNQSVLFSCTLRLSMSTRSYESSYITARAAQDWILSNVGCHRQQPYDIPVSQVLRNERNRGLELAGSIQNWWRYGSGRRTSNSIKLGAHDRYTRITGVVTPCGTSAQRPFSTSLDNQRPPSARKPLPPLPPRVSPAPSSRLAASSPERDVLSKLSNSGVAVTGEELVRQSRNEQDKIRNQETKEERIRYRFYQRIKWIESQARLRFDIDNPFPTSSQYVNSRLEQARKAGLADLEREYEKTKSLVVEFERRCRETGAFIQEFPGQIMTEMTATAVKARKEYIWNRHLISSGLDSLINNVSNVETTERTLRREVAHLKYTIDWRVWNEEKTNFQLEEVIEAVAEQKAEREMHHQSAILLTKLSSPTAEIAKRLNNFEDVLIQSGHRMPLNELKTYLKMLAGRDSVAVADGYPPLGHIWRKLDRHALIASRFPELVNYSYIMLQADSVFYSIISYNREIGDLLKYRHRASKSTRSKTIWRRMLKRHVELNSATFAFIDDYSDFLRQGLVILNPVLASGLGYLKYAALRPLSAYLVSVEAAETVLRRVIESLQQMNSFSEGQAASARWREHALMTLESALKERKELTRPLLHNIASYSYRLIARLVVNDDPYLRQLFSRMAMEAELEVRYNRAFEKLRQTSLRPKLDPMEMILDPTTLLGNNNVYPSSAGYPVEYVTSGQRTFEVMNEMMSSKVVGVELVRHPESNLPAYVCIANTERVVIIENPPPKVFGRSRSAVDWPLFSQLLENPSVVKVFFNLWILDNDAVGRFTNAKSVIGLDDTIRKTYQSRPTLNGHWEPPRWHHRHTTPLPRFLTGLAFLPAYNLVTFLNLATPQRIALLKPSLKAGLQETRNNLRSKLINAHNSNLVLGPVEWNNHSEDFFSTGYGKSSAAHDEGLVGITTYAAVRELFRRSYELAGEDYNKMRDGLAAYYMFTTFSQKLAKIGVMLSIDDVGSAILRTSKLLNLQLHANDYENLRVASRIAEESPTTVVSAKQSKQPTEKQLTAPIAVLDVTKSYSPQRRRLNVWTPPIDEYRASKGVKALMKVRKLRMKLSKHKGKSRSPTPKGILHVLTPSDHNTSDAYNPFSDLSKSRVDNAPASNRLIAQEPVDAAGHGKVRFTPQRGGDRISASTRRGIFRPALSETLDPDDIAKGSLGSASSLEREIYRAGRVGLYSHEPSDFASLKDSHRAKNRLRRTTRAGSPLLLSIRRLPGKIRIGSSATGDTNKTNWNDPSNSAENVLIKNSKARMLDADPVPGSTSETEGRLVRDDKSATPVSVIRLPSHRPARRVKSALQAKSKRKPSARLRISRQTAR